MRFELFKLLQHLRTPTHLLTKQAIQLYLNYQTQQTPPKTKEREIKTTENFYQRKDQLRKEIQEVSSGIETVMY